MDNRNSLERAKKISIDVQINNVTVLSVVCVLQYSLLPLAL
jgi:hypothetical protein